MTNSVFDLSNMFFRSMFIVGGFGKKQYTFDSQEELDQLMRKVATDVSSVIRQVNPARVIFALDSRSWRKDISIDENEGYKGNRIKSDSINWDNFYSIMDEFSKIMENNGFIVSRIHNAEADDLMALWRNKIIESKEHVILISGDEDIRQLVGSYDISGKSIFSTVFNPFTQGKNSSKKLFVPEGFELWIDDEDDIGDIFNRSIDVDKEDFKRILNDEKVKMEIIDGNEIAFRKIFCGDDGDNVPAIFTWINDKNKEVRITPSKYKKISNIINPATYKDFLEKTNIEIIENNIKEMSGQSALPFKMKDRLKRQIKLVVLNENEFPKEIVHKFNEDLSKNMNKPPIHPQSFNMVSLLEGTRYVNAKGQITGNESSIFNQVDRISNKELF